MPGMPGMPGMGGTPLPGMGTPLPGMMGGGKGSNLGQLAGVEVPPEVKALVEHYGTTRGIAASRE